MALAKSVPHRAITLAESVLGEPTDTGEQATALWALGQGRHELGQNAAALEALRSAISIADDPLRSRVEVTTAAVESAIGMSTEAMARLSRLVDHDEPRLAGLARSQRGLLRLHLGDGSGALEDLRSSLPLLESSGDERAAVTRVRGNIGLCLALIGRYRDAVADLEWTLADAKATGQHTVVASSKQNLGYAKMQLGELPSALQLLEEARAEYQVLGDPSRGLTGLYDDLAETYRLAGLTVDAVRYARIGSWTARQADNLERQAEAEYRRAVCLLEHGNKQGADDAARRAAVLFERGGRHLWRQRAELISIEVSSGDVVEAGVIERISVLVDDLFRRGHINEPRSLVNRLVHRLIDIDRFEDATELLVRHGDVRKRLDQGPEGIEEESLLDRLESHYQMALHAVLDHRSAADPIMEARALVGEHNLALGDQELRAGSVRLTERFRSLALRNALSAAGEVEEVQLARQVLLAEEEWRAIAMTLPRAVAAADDETAELLVDLRRANRAVPEESEGTEPDDLADRMDRKAELEDQLRFRSMTGYRVADLSAGPATPAGGAHPTPRRSLDQFFVDDLASQLTGALMIEWLEYQGELIGVSVSPDGSTSMWSAGSRGDADRLARFIHQSLGDLNAATTAPEARSALADLREDCIELRQQLWPSGVGGLATGGPPLGTSVEVHSYVLSPPAPLMALPWRMIAGSASQSVAVTLTPSFEHWKRLNVSTESGVLFDSAAVITGPGLIGPARDEAVVKRVLPHIEVLGEGEAECERVKDVLTSVQFVHLACHGSFRPESPRFSSLTMTDGPLTLFELDWLEKVPDVVMLAACDSGKVSSRPGGELLGTAPALLAAGASTVIAPICPVRDQEVSEALVPFYQALTHGPSAAARAMDEAVADGRPELVATAAAFQVVGATVEFVDR